MRQTWEISLAAVETVRTGVITDFSRNCICIGDHPFVKCGCILAWWYDTVILITHRQVFFLYMVY